MKSWFAIGAWEAQRGGGGLASLGPQGPQMGVGLEMAGGGWLGFSLFEGAMEVAGERYSQLSATRIIYPLRSEGTKSVKPLGLWVKCSTNMSDEFGFYSRGGWFEGKW